MIVFLYTKKLKMYENSYFSGFFKTKCLLTNVKTSTPQENKNIDDDDFVLIKKCISKGVFDFSIIGFVVICNYTLSKKLCFF